MCFAQFLGASVKIFCFQIFFLFFSFFLFYDFFLFYASFWFISDETRQAYNLFQELVEQPPLDLRIAEENLLIFGALFGVGVQKRGFKTCVPQVTRQVNNLFQNLWNKFLGFMARFVKPLVSFIIKIMPLV